MQRKYAELALLINEHVFDNELPVNYLRIKTSKKLIEGYALGMTEWYDDKEKMVLTFSEKIPKHWRKANDLPVKMVGLVAHEMAHAIAFFRGEIGLKDSHKGKEFRKLLKKAAKRTGVPLSYFGKNGRI